MEDYNKVLEATEVSENASGTATEKMTIWNQSLTAAQNDLTAAIQTFAMDSNISEIMKLGIQGLTKIIQLLDLLLNKIPLISPLLRAVGSAFVVAFGTKVISNIATTAKTIEKLKAVLPGVTNAFAAAGGGVAGFKAALAAMITPAGAVLAILSAIIALAPVVASAWNEMFPSAEERIDAVNEAFDTAQQEVEDTQNQLDKINEKIKEIDDKGTLTLADESEKKKLEDQRDILEDILQYKKDIANEKLDDKKEEYGSQFKEKYQSDKIDYGKQYEYITQDSNGIASNYGAASGYTDTDYFNTESASVAQLMANLQKLEEQRKSLNKEDKNYGATLEDNNTKMQENINALKARAVSIAEDIQKMQELGLTDKDYYQDAMSQLYQIKTYIDPSGWATTKLADLLDTSGMTEKVQEAVKKGGDAAETTVQQAANNLAVRIMNDSSLKQGFADAFNINVDDLSIPELAEQIKIIFHQMFASVKDDAIDSASGFETQEAAMQTYISTVAEVAEKQKILNTAYSEMKKNGELSVSTVQSLIEQEPSLVSALSNEEGAIRIDISALEDLSDSYYDTKIAAAESQKEQLESVVSGAISRIKAYGQEMSALDKLMAKMRQVSQSNWTANDLEQYKGMQRTKYQLEKDYEIIDEYNEIQNYIDNLTALRDKGLNTNPTKSSGSGGSKKTPQEKALDAAKDAYNLDKTALDTKKEELEVVKSNLEATKEIYETEKDRLENDKDIIEQHKKLLEQKLDEVKDAQEAMAYLIDLTEKKLKQQYENEKTRLNSIKDYIGEIQDAVDGVKDNYEEVLDKTKEKLKLDKKAEENQKKITDKAKAIADIQRQLTELEFDDSASAQTQKAELLSKLNDAQDDLEEEQKSQAYDQAEQAVDDAKEKLNTIFDQIDAAIDGVENVIDKYINYVSDVLMEDGNLATQALKQVNDMVSGANPKLLQELYDFNNKYGDHLESTVTKAFTDSLDAVQKYAGETDGTFTGTYQYLGNKNNDLNASIKVDESVIQSIETDIYNTEQKINDVEASIAGVEAKISNVELELKELEISYKKQQLDIQGKSYDSDPDLGKLIIEADQLRQAANDNTKATTDSTKKTAEEIIAERANTTATTANTGATSTNTQSENAGTQSETANTTALSENTTAVGQNTAAQAAGGGSGTNTLGGIGSFIDFSTGKINWKNIGTSMLNFGLQSIQSPTFWSGAIDLISSLLSGTLFSVHEGTNYVSKANSWLDDMLGLGENETARVLEVGEQVIPKGEEVNLTQFDAPFNRDFVTGHPTISNSGNSGDVNIDMGDITANGIDINDLESFLNRKKSEIADYVYSSINKQVKIAGHRNVRGKW